MSGNNSFNPTRDNKPSVQWAKWFIDHGFVVIPLRPGDKRPAIEWKEYAERKPTPEEVSKFLDMIKEGHNYAVLGGHGNLVILDFEDYELAKHWIGFSELSLLCQSTLCVKTVHGGLHIYLIADEVPPHKFNPAFVKGDKTVMDLQSVKSYVVGPGSCINHKGCDSTKCPWKGQDVVTCYEPMMSLEKAEIWEFKLKKLLGELIKRGEALGIRPSPSLLKWLKEGKTEEEQSTGGGGKKEEEKGEEEDFEKLKEEMRKYDRFKGKTVDAIKSELCNIAKKKLEIAGEKAKETLRIAHGVLCEGKSYSDLGIDRSRGDWHLLIFLLTHGVTDVDVIMKLLPSDSKIFSPKWERYAEYTLRKAWERVKPWLVEFKDTDDVSKNELKEKSILIITRLLMKRYKIKTFYQPKGTREHIVGIFVWNQRKGIYEPFENRLRKKARALAEYFISLLRPVKPSKNKKKLEPFVISKSVIDNIVDEIKDKTLTKLHEEPLRIAFPNATLEWVVGQNGAYVPRFIPAEERTPEHFAFHYIPHRIHVEELVKAQEEAVKRGEITIDIVEDLARRVCPKSLETFKQWAGERWITLFEIIGYTLFPKIEFRKAFMILGPKGAGKSTFINLLKELLGPENVANVPLSNLFGEKNRFTLIELYHKLLNAVSETKEYSLDDIDAFKRLTGGDRITADVKFKDPVTFTPYAKLVIATNRPPQVKDKSDEAFWYRWLVVEFPNRFEDSTVWFSKVFTEEELEGILTVAILAFTRVLLRGHFDYEQTEAEVKAIWLSTTDSVFSFINEYTRQGKLILDPSNGDLTVRVKELYRIYMEYCKDNGFNGVGKKAFVRKLREYFGITVQRKYVEVNGEKKRARFFVGIAIADNSILPETRGASEFSEFLDYIRNNTGAEKTFSEIVSDFGGDRAKANRLITFCLSKRLCTYMGVDVIKFGTR